MIQNAKLDRRIDECYKVDEDLMKLLERASSQVQIRSYSGRVSYNDIRNSVFFTLYGQKLQTSECVL